MNRAAAILTKMKRSEHKQIRDDERRILDALRSSGSMSDRTAGETLSRIKLVMAQGRLVLDKVSPRAHEALFSNRALRNRFLASKSACPAFIMSIDIRRSAELMLNARSAELFAEFMAGLCEELKGLICGQVRNCGQVYWRWAVGVLSGLLQWFGRRISSHLGRSRSAPCV